MIDTADEVAISKTHISGCPLRVSGCMWRFQNTCTIQEVWYVCLRKLCQVCAETLNESTFCQLNRHTFKPYNFRQHLTLTH